MAGCDKEDTPFVETPAIVMTNPGNAPVRKVLLEEFTGHYCPKCPNAHKKAAELKQTHGEQVIVYAVHAGYYASWYNGAFDPLAHGDATSYTYDFTSSVGNDLHNYFSLAEMPKGLINRQEILSTFIIEVDDWSPTLATLLNSGPVLSLGISNTYNNNNRELSAIVNAEFLTSMNGSYNLCVYLKEDSIVNWQIEELGDGTIIEHSDYVHRHTLRGSMNNTWGEEIISGSITAGDAISKTYTTTLDTEWNENQMSIVAFVYDFTTKEVLQAEEVHLQH